MPVENTEVVIKVPKGYEPLVDAFLAVLYRMAVGKGRERHAKYDNQELRTQDIAIFSHDWRLDQIRKKAGEVHRLRSRDKSGEVADIAAYALVEWCRLNGHL